MALIVQSQAWFVSLAHAGRPGTKLHVEWNLGANKASSAHRYMYSWDYIVQGSEDVLQSWKDWLVMFITVAMDTKVGTQYLYYNSGAPFLQLTCR